MTVPRVVFHPRVQSDMGDVLQYDREQGGDSLSERFFEMFLATVDRVRKNPQACHPVSKGMRRVAIKGFPYHLLFRSSKAKIRILVLRHDKRHPSFGLSRR